MAKWENAKMYLHFDLIGYSWYDDYIKTGEWMMVLGQVVYSVMMMCSAMAVSHGYLALGSFRIS